MNLLTENEIQFFNELKKNNVPFMIVGMMAAVLQDVPLVTRDIDLWFKNTEDPRLDDVARACGGVFMPASMIFQMPPQLLGDAFKNLDVVYGIAGLNSFDEEYKNAIEIDLEGVMIKILPLDRIIASKSASGRKKDLAVLPILETVLSDKAKK